MSRVYDIPQPKPDDKKAMNYFPLMRKQIEYILGSARMSSDMFERMSIQRRLQQGMPGHTWYSGKETDSVREKLWALNELYTLFLQTPTFSIESCEVCISALLGLLPQDEQ